MSKLYSVFIYILWQTHVFQTKNYFKKWDLIFTTLSEVHLHERKCNFFSILILIITFFYFSVAILAKHLSIEVNLVKTSPLEGETKTEEYLKLNPSHTVPTLVDGDFALFESRAILGYLVTKYAPGNEIYPSEAQARAKVDKVLFFDAASFYPAVKAILVSFFVSF